MLAHGWVSSPMNFSAISNQTPLGRLLRLPLKCIPRSVVVPIVQGRLRGKKWIAGSSDHGCWLGSYEFVKQRLIADMVSPGAVVYDIGAHVGFYTLLFAELVGTQGRVFAFEPVPENFAYLQRHIQLNQCRNITSVQVALGQSTGIATFETRVASSAAGHLSATGGLCVSIFRLDDWVRQQQAQMPDYLKIDVEGAEAGVLDGSRELLRARKPTIFLATHGPEVHAQCCRLLGELGYTLRSVTSASVEQTSELMAV